MPAQLSDKHHQDIDENGFTVIKGLLTPTQVSEYLKYSKQLVNRARSGSWPYVRLNGKQFPPWDKPTDKPDIWGITHLMHPKWGQETSDKFQKIYSSPDLTDVVKDILQTDELTMELFNMLINPNTRL
ncbi:unnamed protein product [Ambrosiozyma monospora]|uniref:Unnamed protein product n=1 Tax=Ambrosiozyma monospora TaxID=43982 RepID=A0ACB5UCL9_AMBMO|nr:unnamed protein product [Ambrosiozyma monospora]